VATEELDGGALLREIVDYVRQVLPPYETSLYIFLLRRSRLEGSPTIRIGKKSICEGFGRGTRSSKPNYQQIHEKLRNLARDGFIRVVGDTEHGGTLYSVSLPSEVPQVSELMSETTPPHPVENYYLDPKLREELFERDEWTCRYCAEAVTPETVTLDHVVPVSRGGTNERENLVTACLMCNSIKSGRTYKEAAADILAALVQRRKG
jgi:hypothetical protein